jgi:hypothetical protein
LGRLLVNGLHQVGGAAVLRVTIVFISVSVSMLASAQEQPPIQNPLEVEIAARFEQAAPGLFKAWLDVRPAMLMKLRLGTVTDSSRPGCGLAVFTYEFVEYADEIPPGDYQIDVKRNDSILTPFVGILTAHFKVRCSLRRAVPKGVNWGREAIDGIAPNCLDKTFAECLKSGKAKPAPPYFGSACTGGPGFSFTYQGAVQTFYRWSKGEWEFEKEKSEPPIEIPTSGQPLRAQLGASPSGA